MKNFFLLIIGLVFSVSNVSAQDSLVISDFNIGKRVSFYSEELKENRTLNIYLPIEYNVDSAYTYPVIYLLDGSAHEDFIHISGLVQFCSYDWIKNIPKSIVVGIENVDRRKDFTFKTKIKGYAKNFPENESEHFINYIKNEVQPYISKTFKTDTLTTLIGQSLGGLLATEILLYHTEMFSQYIIISPSLWWDNESLLSLKKDQYKVDVPVFVAVGKEGKIMEREAEGIYNKLSNSSPDNENIHFQFLEQHEHGDVLHQAVYEAFKVLFKVQK